MVTSSRQRRKSRLRGSRWSRLLQFSSFALLGGCAHLHHYQVADIDSSRGELEAFEIQVDETGFNLKEAGAVAGLAAGSKGADRVSDVTAFLALFQFGSKTGDPTFSDDWADGLIAAVLERCPSGQVTGLVALRESADYPVVSGEVVTLRGYCIK